MNNLFKQEFQNLNFNELKAIINGFAGFDILDINALEDIAQNNYDRKFFMKYIENILCGIKPKNLYLLTYVVLLLVQFLI